MATVSPLSPDKIAPLATATDVPAKPAPKRLAGRVAKPMPLVPPPSPKPVAPGITLDGGWDRKLSRGAVEPDATIDLHGHTLTSAHGLLDQALERSRARGDRVILLITGKPPRRESERPHARGAIRAAVGDWLHASRHAAAIAAVRNAAPRHGGAGALYIILRRARSAPKS
ncbi:MAG: Smr/MutS family protein [Sphingomonas sp.]|nr:Smr/MutS family protein [Sphingomonas sp.]